MADLVQRANEIARELALDPKGRDTLPEYKARRKAIERALLLRADAQAIPLRDGAVHSPEQERK